MAKIRTLKAEFFRHEDISHGLVAKVLAAGLICCMADDEGRFKASVGAIRGEVFTHDEVTNDDVEAALQHLASSGFVRLYEAEGRRYGVVVNWRRHQRVPPSRFTASSFPPPPTPAKAQARRRQTASTAQADSRRTPAEAQADRKHGAGGQQADASSRAGVGEERRGEEYPPYPPKGDVPVENPGKGPPLSARAVELLRGYDDLVGRVHSAAEAIAAEEFCAALTVLSPAEMLERMRGHLAWCDETRTHRPNSLGGFWRTLRLENDRQHDLGVQPIRAGPRPAGLARIDGLLAQLGDIAQAGR